MIKKLTLALFLSENVSAVTLQTLAQLKSLAPDCTDNTMCVEEGEVCLRATKYDGGRVFDTRCGPRDKCGQSIDNETAYLYCGNIEHMEEGATADPPAGAAEHPAADPAEHPAADHPADGSPVAVPNGGEEHPDGYVNKEGGGENEAVPLGEENGDEGEY